MKLKSEGEKRKAKREKLFAFRFSPSLVKPFVVVLIRFDSVHPCLSTNLISTRGRALDCNPRRPMSAESHPIVYWDRQALVVAVIADESRRSSATCSDAAVPDQAAPFLHVHVLCMQPGRREIDRALVEGTCLRMGLRFELQMLRTCLMFDFSVFWTSF